LLEQKFDAVCIKEIKAANDKLPREVKNISGYFKYFVSAEQKGYSGVGIFSKRKPLNVETGMGIEKFDKEGRFLRVDYDDFTLMNIYFPNGTLKILFIVLRKYYFSTLFGSFLL